MGIAVSPNFDGTKLAGGAIGDKIDVFEDQVRGWLLAPAQATAAGQHAGFALLALVLMYFEPLGQFLEGKAAASEPQFRKGLQAVFPNSASEPVEVFTELYNQLRCGMFHRGITKGKVRIGRGLAHPIVVEHAGGHVAGITVDPWLLLGEVDGHLSRYVSELRNPENTDLRKKFETWFDLRDA